jgi:hypothetical protein
MDELPANIQPYGEVLKNTMQGGFLAFPQNRDHINKKAGLSPGSIPKDARFARA